MFNSTIVQEKGISTIKYGIAVLNPDGTKIGGGNSTTTPYTMFAYYDNGGVTYNYSYYAEALSGTLITENKWRCFKVTSLKDGTFISKTWATTNFSNLGDESTVKGLIYA